MKYKINKTILRGDDVSRFAVFLLSLTLLQLILALIVYDPRGCDTVFEYSRSINVFTYLFESQLMCVAEIVVGCLILKVAFNKE